MIHRPNTALIHERYTNDTLGGSLSGVSGQPLAAEILRRGQAIEIFKAPGRKKGAKRWPAKKNDRPD